MLVFNFKWRISFRVKKKKLKSLAELNKSELFYLGSKEPSLFILFFIKFLPMHSFKSKITLQIFIQIGTIWRVKGAIITKLCQTNKDKLGLSQTNPTYKKYRFSSDPYPLWFLFLRDNSLSIFLMFTPVLPIINFYCFSILCINFDFLLWNMKNDLFYTTHSYTIFFLSFSIRILYIHFNINMTI